MASRRVAPIPPKGNEKSVKLLVSSIITSKDKGEKNKLRNELSKLIDRFIETGEKSKKTRKTKKHKKHKNKKGGRKTKSKRKTKKKKNKKKNKTMRKQRK
tara:strand:+ start:359 stop:658 length:300 start_codon:yes stop_codon:yes gene_type:complete